MPQSTAAFRFYAELNDFLTDQKRNAVRCPDGARELEYPFNGHPSVKDSIEAMGVPHTEVDLVVANGASVDFSYGLQNGDKISVYPVFESLDISPVTHLRPKPLRETKFILDVHLGKLCGDLRLLGFDTRIMQQADDLELIRISLEEHRIILTRNAQLLKNGKITHGSWVRSQNTREQLRDAVRRFDLAGQVRPFTRCLVCNGEQKPVPKAEIEALLEPKIRDEFQEFTQCGSCQKIYWKGSHYDRMKEYIETVISEAGNGQTGGQTA